MTRKMMVITGANGQIGSWLAHQYAGQENPLLLLYHQEMSRIEDLEGKAGILLKACDLCHPKAVEEALETAARELAATPAYLIHTAAVRSYDARTLAEGDPDIFASVITQNILAAYHILRYTLPFMQANRFGRVVLFGSNVVQSGLYRGSAYAAAKSAIVNLAQSVALENAAFNILINSISPAPVETRLEDDYEGEYLAFRKDYFAQARKSSPTGKLVSREEIKCVVDLLLSDLLSNLNGENIIIDGGFSGINIQTKAEEN